MLNIPILSVIVPSYNMEKYLPKCLGSLVVAPELMEKLEVLVVNDGSKDRTSEIAHEFAAKWPQTFKVIDKENGHYGSCINAALPLATGVFVKVLDADDYVNTEAFAEWLGALESENADLVICGYREVDRAGAVIAEKLYGIEGNNFLPIQSVTYHRRVFEGWNYRQLEGVAYTDCQFVGEPMLRVKTVRMFSRAVVCYLVERDDRSMAPECRVLQLEQQLKVDLYLAKLHAKGRPEGCSDLAWAYFERLCFREIGEFYHLATVGAAGRFPAFEFGERFDAALKIVDPDCWMALAERNDVSIRIASLFKVNYVKLWRHPQHRLRLRLLRAYARIR